MLLLSGLQYASLAFLKINILSFNTTLNGVQVYRYICALPGLYGIVVLYITSTYFIPQYK